MAEPYGQKHLQELLILLKNRGLTPAQKKAIVWAADQAIDMSGGGHPDDYLSFTEEANTINKLARKV